MGEKRRYMRFNVLMEAVCRTSDALKKITVNNFSREGLGILSKESFRDGEDLDMELMIPGDNVPVLLKGEVVWMSGPASDDSVRKGGVRLKKINNDDRSRILEYIYHKWITPASAEVK